jgi:hypothetical protein
MTGTDQRPITAASLAATPEWTAIHPGAEIVWEDRADEGAGIGFDGLDPSAMVRALFQVDDPWDDVVAGYRARLAADGWIEEHVLPYDWWRWRNPNRTGASFTVILRPAGPGMFRPPGIRDGAVVFEVSYRRSPSAVPLATDHA